MLGSMTARMWRAALRSGLVGAAAGILLLPWPALAQRQPAFVGRRVTAVVLEREGLSVTDPALLILVTTRVGAPLSMTDVRETIAHLDGLDRFDDIQVLPEADSDGVRLRDGHLVVGVFSEVCFQRKQRQHATYGCPMLYIST